MKIQTIGIGNGFFKAKQVTRFGPSIIGNVTEADRVNLILEFKAEQSRYFEFESVPYIVRETQED